MKQRTTLRSPRAILALAAAIAMGLAVTSSAQTAPSKPAGRPAATPRTPWGDPDLQGTYSNSNESGIPMQRPADFAGRRLEDVSQAELSKLIEQRRKQQANVAITIGGSADNDTGAGPSHWYENANASNSRAWMISDPQDGQMPALTDEARQRAAAVRTARRGGDGYNQGPFDGPEDLTLYVRCITRGLPGSMMPAIYGNAYEILQGPGYVAIQYEMVHETRIIPLTGQPHPGPAVRMYMGDAKGHFEGNTLVVETTNFTDKTPYRGSSEFLKMTERFKPVAPDTVEWSVTFDDPHTWARPWTFAMNLTKKDDSQRPFEYACSEGNYGMVGILNAARAEEKAGGAVDIPRDAEGER
jgi:hypothetical protein